MQYFSDTLRYEWLQAQDLEWSITMMDLYPLESDLDRQEVRDHIVKAHSLIFQKEDYVEWLANSLGVPKPINPTSPPYGLKLNTGDKVLVANWAGRSIKWDEDFFSQVNNKSIAFVEWRMLTIK